jgi:hypothetical protein
VNPGEYAGLHRVISWKDCVLPSWWRVLEDRGGTI